MVILRRLFHVASRPAGPSTPLRVVEQTSFLRRTPCVCAPPLPHLSPIEGRAGHASPGLLSGRCREREVQTPPPGPDCSSLGCTPELGLRGSGGSIVECLRNLHSVPTVGASFAIPPALGRGSFPPHPHSASWFCCCFDRSHPDGCAVTSQCPWWLSHTGCPGEVWPGLWSPPTPAMRAGQGRCVRGTGAGRQWLRGRVGGRVWRKGRLHEAKLIPSPNPAH